MALMELESAKASKHMALVEDKHTPKANWEKIYRPHLKCAEALPAPRGSLITWADNLIHWSSACQPGERHPRVSVAATFYRKGEGHVSEAGVITRDQVRSLGLKGRLKIIANAMLLYHHWHPGFRGFPETNLQRFAAEDLAGHRDARGVRRKPWPPGPSPGHAPQ